MQSMQAFLNSEDHSSGFGVHPQMTHSVETTGFFGVSSDLSFLFSVIFIPFLPEDLKDLLHHPNQHPSRG